MDGVGGVCEGAGPVEGVWPMGGKECGGRGQAGGWWWRWWVEVVMDGGEDGWRWMEVVMDGGDSGGESGWK